MNDKLENFERAFRMCSSGCRRLCNCGITYFDHQQSYDWNEGELEELLRASESPNGKAVGLPYSPSDMMFEGKQYVDACSCWHARAEQIMGFLDSHAHAVADYLTLEKKRLQAIADEAPVVR